MPPQFTVKSMDDVVFKIDFGLIAKNAFLTDLAKRCTERGGDVYVPVLDMSAPILDLVLKWISNEPTPKDVSINPFEPKHGGNIDQNFKTQFFNVPPKYLYELVAAATMMRVRMLVQSCQEEIAKFEFGKSMDEINALLL